jgi:predicted nuclease of restriction endonuclease-like (RecB) superfamily
MKKLPPAKNDRIMAKKITAKSTPPAKRGTGYSALVKAISQVNTEMVTRAASVVNQALVLRNWMVGSYIVEFEQHGADRAKYGANLLDCLARDMAAQGIKALCDPRVLRDCRLLYRFYPQIRGSLTRESPGLPNAEPEELAIRGSATRELPSELEVEQVLRLSWTKLQELIRLDDPWQRAFYENECLRSHWSVRQLQRQIGSLLYERTGLSTNKKAVIERARKQEPRESIADLLRDPYVLEFTGLAELPSYSEDELESALLDHLQKFLLELGQGFCFEGRQFRMTEGRRHHRVDLVFYHRILRCHVLIDLKIRAFKPEDAGQMNFYVNWFKANMTQPGDNPPVGILLCSDRDGAEVEFATAGMDNKLFVSRYLKSLPSAEQLKAFLEKDRAEIKALTKGKR